MHVSFRCVCFSFSVLSQEIGLEEHLRNDLLCVGWDVKPQLNQSTKCSLIFVSFHPMCNYLLLLNASVGALFQQNTSEVRNFYQNCCWQLNVFATQSEYLKSFYV